MSAPDHDHVTDVLTGALAAADRRAADLTETLDQARAEVARLETARATAQARSAALAAALAAHRKATTPSRTQDAAQGAALRAALAAVPPPAPDTAQAPDWQTSRYLLQAAREQADQPRPGDAFAPRETR